MMQIVGVLFFGFSLLYMPFSQATAFSEEDAVREAVFRYQFRKNVSALKTAAGVYCLSVLLAGEELQDPSHELMARFRGHVPPVKKRSECDVSRNGVYDKTTRAQGLMFYLKGTRLTSPDTAEVYGGYYENGLSSSGNTFILRRQEGKWIVVRAVMMWIS